MRRSHLCVISRIEPQFTVYNKHADLNGRLKFRILHLDTILKQLVLTNIIQY